ncbi:MAG: hypothetical protein A2566_01755 [Candidatus Zambryskibacteria bacterium RIFOXYD1_FULL_40_13]|nr:MAG: hypothetical protein UT25_C0001G0045 [Parcubacteria group bacterium GW2011_GWC1_39_12]KKR19569.1 MAG: hypothetical protein UT49_C0001G0045 [Parcubacteria group bacterium GW2011_GWF1_39_37]KKR35723.1 MAG: hypothetical protein UT68_C0001G0046 [Parcubacteria group bacterium GW2011_GWC2_40_10]KKR52537.1 MAG: hypothetical protein UT89_C0001G0045 [Parcubacteria group bacterium GW2011_GWE1_40_20]KKR64706.1 MAG: hypothetical protein UU06_C0044G0003 [Parcubacteria group bacterium GW2011_GWB1_40_
MGYALIEGGGELHAVTTADGRFTQAEADAWFGGMGWNPHPTISGILVNADHPGKEARFAEIPPVGLKEQNIFRLP